ncbi:MAG: adenylate/guanylate cyclase domain-containing protein [Candidatus Porifericomitaceae bacterium WSBS_2022_MAG_OTU9]
MSTTAPQKPSENSAASKAKAYSLAVMFADVSGSTKLFETIGDTLARRAIAELLIDAIKIIRNHTGKVVKTIGDEVMCVYAKPLDAVNAASSIHEMLETKTFGNQNLTMRIGIHYGTALLEQEGNKKDFFGDGVNVAARMVAQAKSEQTIVSQDVVNKLPPDMQEMCRFVDSAHIKGKHDVMDIHEVIWKQEDATCMALSTANVALPTEDSSMFVSYNGKSIKIDRAQPSVVIGRSKSCDMPVNEELASRNHVLLELRRDKFFLIDQSTNGTHIRNAAGEDTFLRREEMLLTGNGSISLGRAFSEDPVEVVKYSQDEPSS